MRIHAYKQDRGSIDNLPDVVIFRRIVKSVHHAKMKPPDHAAIFESSISYPVVSTQSNPKRFISLVG